MGTAIGMLFLWAISLVILIFVIGAGVRVGMRWSRIDERKEQIARSKLRSSQDAAYRDGDPMFNYKPKKKFK